MKLGLPLGTFTIALSFCVLADADKGMECFKDKNYSCALSEWSRAAELGNSVAQYNLGLMYKAGRGVEQNDAKAVEWYQKAAAQDYDPASLRLAAMYAKGEGLTQDYAKASEWFRKAFEQGLSAGADKNEPATMFPDDLSRKKALEWYQKASDEGNANAQYILAAMYAKGVGVNQDYAKAAEWYRKATDQNIFELEYIFKSIQTYYVSEKEATAWYSEAAEKGHPLAQYQLALTLYQSQKTEHDWIRAAELFHKAAEQEIREAYVMLALFYDNGHGVKQDKAIALNWIIKYVEKSDDEKVKAEMQFQIAQRYSDVLFKAHDFAKAIEWYQRAADKNHNESQYSLGLIYEEGRGVAQDYTKAIEWYQRAADKNHDESQYSLGLIYEEGRGVTQDYTKAVKWFQKAAEQDHVRSLIKLGSMYEAGLGVKQDYAKAIELYQKAADRGDYSSEEKVVNLKCKMSFKTELFGVLLKCANRNQLMTAVKKAGATVKLEDKTKWGDSYNSSDILKGSSVLNIAYTVDDRFAFAEYIFPSNLDAGQIVQIRNFIANKYGKPNNVNGNVSLGEASFEWLLEDGIILKVSRDWPDTTTYLSFSHPENYKEMMAELRKQQKKREDEDYKKQSNAF